LIIEKARLDSHEYDVVFIGGSGTLAIESVFWSTLHGIKVIGNQGLWYDKWKEFSKIYSVNKESEYHNMYCQLETSNSKIFNESNCIVDGISSFPYYDIPKNTKIFVTCSNKQLGSIAGLGIVFVRKDFWSELKDDKLFSYMNISRYRKYGSKGQTPSTSTVTIFQDLYERLKRLEISSLRSKINDNSKLLIDLFGGSPSPVFVIPKKEIPIEIASKYDLYGLNTDSENYSIFTYSSDDDHYRKFFKEFKS
tara:strand:+ start:1585 stop:2337 length:753 start_codon:yes stop_codon:yes gene_type:complete